VRTLIDRHLPADYRAKETWRYVSKLLAGAAKGEEDVGDVEIALRLVLAMEGVECGGRGKRPQRDLARVLYTRIPHGRLGKRGA
jgi:hypothetical protein